MSKATTKPRLTLWTLSETVGALEARVSALEGIATVTANGLAELAGEPKPSSSSPPSNEARDLNHLSDSELVANLRKGAEIVDMFLAECEARNLKIEITSPEAGQPFRMSAISVKRIVSETIE